MAKLTSLTREVELVVSPRRVLEREPTWIITQLEVRRENRPLLSTTVSVTLEDLSELRQGAHSVLSGAQTNFRVRSSDEDFAFDAEAYDLVESYFVSIWTGEPNSLMHGYRFMVDRSALSQFLTDLESEERALNAETGSSLP